MNYNSGNPLGLDLDNFGNPLNTQRNMDILSEIERQKAMSQPYYGNAPAGYAPAPNYGGGYPQGGFVERGRDNYYPEQISSRESDRFMYRENGGMSRTNYPDNSSYYPESVRHNPRNDNAAPRSSKYDHIEDNNPPVSYPKANNYTESFIEEKPVLKTSDLENRIQIPHNGIYHWTLLPKGLKEERVVTATKILSEGYKTISGTKQKVFNIGEYYASSIIKTEEGSMNTVDRFSEELFHQADKDRANSKTIKLVDMLEKEVKVVTSFSNNHLVNRLLMEISRTPNFDKDTVYTFDYINNTRYYSSKSQNLFIKAAEETNTFQDRVNSLSEIFAKYAENETNINSLLTIDNELTRDFLTFIRGFTGNESIKCLSFMNSVGKIYVAADSYVDMVAQRNIKTGIERFTNILFLNIKMLKDTLGEDLSGIYVPRKELSIITKSNSIREELASMQEINSSRFYLVDEGYTPELAKAIEEVDNAKVISKYTKVTLYTIDGLYQIVKTKGKGYYIALVDIYKI